MAPSDAAEKITATNQTIAIVAVMLASYEPVMSQLLEETRDMDNFGHIVDPTLWRSEERRRSAAIHESVYRAALAFLYAHRRAAEEIEAWKRERADG